MMRALNNKKNVRIFSIVLAAVFVFGVAGIAYMQMSSPSMASSTSSIGVVDPSKVISSDSAVVTNARQELQTYSQTLQKEFETKSANMDDAQKQQLFMEYQQKMQAKQTELQGSMEKQVQDATKSIADAKGLSIVLNKNVVLYGGEDITDQVAKKFTATTETAK